MPEFSTTAEQLEAIQNLNGGVLRAGAGAGKTFVLVEHLLFYIEEKIFPLLDHFPVEKRDYELRTELKRIAVVTFTRKAAAEILFRVRKRVEVKKNEANSRPSEQYWELFARQLPALKITTIHGLCASLIRLGLVDWENLPDSISEGAFLEESIQQEILRWIQIEGENLPKEARTLFLLNSHRLAAGLKIIFTKAESRIQWENSEEVQKTAEDLWSDYGLFHRLPLTGDLEIPLELAEKHTGKKWADFLIEVQARLKAVPAEMAHHEIEKFTADWGRFPACTKKGEEFQKAKSALKKIKIIRDAYRDFWNKTVFPLRQSEEQIGSSWQKLYQNLFHHLNEQYYLNWKDLSYSDLEYIVYTWSQKNLEKNVKNPIFEKMIVDEFQDTSFLQHEILFALVGHKSPNYYVIGDPQQAIYRFRGGDISIFKKIERQSESVLYLTQNFRSLPINVEFNNHLCSDLLHKDQEVSASHFAQMARPDSTGGGVEVGEYYFENKGKLTSSEIEQREARLLFHQILGDPAVEIAVLYKKLAPSLQLISLLIESQTGFTAQIKVPSKLSPLRTLFFKYLEILLFDKENVKEHYAEFCFYLLSYISSHVSLGEAELLVDELLKNSEKNSEEMVDVDAFFLFLYRLPLNLPTGIGETEAIRDLCHYHHHQREQIYDSLRQNQKTVSVNLSFFSDSQRIQILSCHQAKGLEYQSVYLGGASTNGRAPLSQEIIGKNLNSFRYTTSEKLKRFYKTPEFLIEEDIEKHLGQEESKRLLYVACTRAVDKLFWIDFHTQDPKDFSLHPDSWAALLNPLKASESVTKSRLEHLPAAHGEAFQSERRPLFHLHPMGSFPLPGVLSAPMTIPTPSVTKLVETWMSLDAAWDLMNFSEEDIERLKSLNYYPEKSFPFVAKTEVDSENASEKAPERGVRIHRELSQWVKRYSANPKLVKEIIWPFKTLTHPLEEYRFFSEAPLRFPWNHIMVSGTPDFVALHQKESEIWDFKTGKISSELLIQYKMQLEFYAHALYALQVVDAEQTLLLKIIAIDQKDIIAWETRSDLAQEVLGKSSSHNFSPSESIG